MKKLLIGIIIIVLGVIIVVKGYSLVKRKFDTSSSNSQQTLNTSSTYANNQNNNSVNNQIENSNNITANNINTQDNSSNNKNNIQSSNINSQSINNITTSQTESSQNQGSNTKQASNPNNTSNNSSVINNTSSNISTSNVNTNTTSNASATTNINILNYMGVWEPSMEAQWNQDFNKNIIPISKQLEENTLIMTPQKYSFNGLTINNPEYKIVPVEDAGIFGNAHMGDYGAVNASTPNSEIGIPKTPYSNLYYIVAYPKGKTVASAENNGGGFMLDYPYIVDNHVFAILNSPEQPIYRFTKQ